MSELCLLAAAVAASQAQQQQLPTPPTLVSRDASASQHSCRSSNAWGPSVRQTTAHSKGHIVVERQAPEFSPPPAAYSITPQSGRPDSARMPTIGDPSLDAAVLSRPRSQSLDWSLVKSTDSSVSAGSASGSNDLATASRKPLQLASLAHVAVPATKARRPASGRQFFRQRWVALQTGRSYTRLASDSFAQQWVNATYQPSHEDWIQLLSQEANAMARGQGNNRLTILLGDSISLWFPTDYMARYRFWLNQSISGDTAAGALQRLTLFAQTNPDTIHVMLGINDLRQGASDAQLLRNQQQIVRRLRQQHPQAQVIVHSILPTRWLSLPGDRISSINQRLEAIASQEGAQFLNLHPYFMDAQGMLRADLTTDGLHLNAQGYALWYRILSHLNLV